MAMTVEINGLRCYARHGVLEQERIVGNEFEVTVHLHLNECGAVDSDDLSATVNYAEVCTLIRDVMNKPSQLLEHVCGRLRDAIRNGYPMVSGGMGRVAKLKPPIPAVQMQSVAIALEW